MTAKGRRISIGIRGVDEDIWLAFRAHCVKTGTKTGEAVTDAMRREAERMRAEESARRRRG